MNPIIASALTSIAVDVLLVGGGVLVAYVAMLGKRWLQKAIK